MRKQPKFQFYTKLSVGIKQPLFRVFHLHRPDEIYLDQAEDQVGFFVLWGFFYLLSQHYHLVYFSVKFILYKLNLRHWWLKQRIVKWFYKEQISQENSCSQTNLAI